MKRQANPKRRRGTVLLMIVGLLAMLFMLVSAYITLAHYDRVNQRYVTRSAEVDEIMAGIHDLALAQLARTAAERPGAAVTGANYADIPGYGGVDENGRQWGSAWLAALEPVVKPTANPSDPVYPQDLTYPAVTSFTGRPSGAMTVNDLMRDYNMLDTLGVDVRPGVAANPHTVGAARQPWMDADGDGIPDASFVQQALVNELANAIGGRNVRAPTANPVLLKDPLQPRTLDEERIYNMWQAFDRQARYQAAVRVVSNGGLVMLGNDPAGAWNRQFTRAMLNWVRHPWDQNRGTILVKEPLGSDIEIALADITLAAGDVEPLLRQRNGLLIGEKGDNEENVPPALATLLLLQDQRLAWTLSPRQMWQSAAIKPDSWQRFNLMNTQFDEWSAWRYGAALGGNDYLAFFNTGGYREAKQARTGAVPRRLLTTANYSDDLAREVNPNFTRLKPESTSTPEISNLGLDPGQPKFYLGRTKEAFDDIAFHPERGAEIVRQLASYYHEMLSAYNWGQYYDGYNTLVAPPGDEANNEPTEQKLRSQAFMLAVNTVQFTAPRATDGFMDVVRYTDADAPTNWQRTYHAYGPQPFITQVVVYNKESTPGPGGSESSSLGIAVELYNPNYPNFVEGVDTHALYLPQFALSVSETFDPAPFSGTEQTGLCVLSSELPEADLQWQGPNMGARPNRMEGQTFCVVSLREVGGHQYFDSWLESQPQLDRGKMVGNGLQGSFYVVEQGQPTNKIKVKLWRTPYRNQPGRTWHLVDEFTVEPASTTHKDFTHDAARNMDRVPYLPANATFPDRAPRWNMVVIGSEFEYEKDYKKGAPPTTVLNSLGNDKPLSTPPAPTVMLPLMNVGPDVQWRIHGAYRPGSFPTVGFMLFIPRYCHIYNETTGRRLAMGEVLYDAWDALDGDGFGYTMPGSGTRPYPLDFGHMPVFDNHQDLADEDEVPSGFHQTGRLPWGLLVFDYFTTINPDGEDGDPETTADNLDPRRIAGRININAAPWYVLAGLPVIGPATDWAGDNLPLPTDASPAFWSAATGVLAGSDVNGELRFNPDFLGSGGGRGMGLFCDRDMPTSGTSGMWRLGPYLALAATAYRDRVQYATQIPYISGEPRLNNAHQRNNHSNPDMYYRPVLRYGRDTPTGDHIDDNEYSGGIRRQRTVGGVAQNHRGFLTLGELANVMGFDKQVLYEPAGGATPKNTDFFQAVSLLALLDTHFLTTRSNTYTIYTSLIDREVPQASLRSQVTIDRTRLLPHFVWQDRQRNGDTGYGAMDPPDDPANPAPTGEARDLYTIFQETGTPELIGRRELSYFNARYDN